MAASVTIYDAVNSVDVNYGSVSSAYVNYNPFTVSTRLDSIFNFKGAVSGIAYPTSPTDWAVDVASVQYGLDGNPLGDSLGPGQLRLQPNALVFSLSSPALVSAYISWTFTNQPLYLLVRAVVAVQNQQYGGLDLALLYTPQPLWLTFHSALLVGSELYGMVDLACTAPYCFVETSSSLSSYASSYIAGSLDRQSDAVW